MDEEGQPCECLGKKCPRQRSRGGNERGSPYTGGVTVARA